MWDRVRTSERDGCPAAEEGGEEVRACAEPARSGRAWRVGAEGAGVVGWGESAHGGLVSVQH